MSNLPTEVYLSNQNQNETILALKTWLSPSVAKVEYGGSSIPVAKLLDNPYEALNIARHEEPKSWQTVARIHFDSSEEATVIVTMKGLGGTDRIRLTISQSES